MITGRTIMERAFELAREGGCTNLTDLKVTLSREGFSSVDWHLDGPSLRKQLAALIREAKRAAETAGRTDAKAAT